LIGRSTVSHPPMDSPPHRGFSWSPPFPLLWSCLPDHGKYQHSFRDPPMFTPGDVCGPSRRPFGRPDDRDDARHPKRSFSASHTTPRPVRTSTFLTCGPSLGQDGAAILFSPPFVPPLSSRESLVSSSTIFRAAGKPPRPGLSSFSPDLHRHSGCAPLGDFLFRGAPSLGTVDCYDTCPRPGARRSLLCGLALPLVR